MAASPQAPLRREQSFPLGESLPQAPEMSQSQTLVIRIEDVRVLVGQAFDDGIAAMRLEQQRLMSDLFKQLQATFSNCVAAPGSPEAATYMPAVQATTAASTGRSSMTESGLKKIRATIGTTEHGVDWSKIPHVWPHAQREADLHGGTPEEIARQAVWFTKTKKFVASPKFEVFFGILIMINLITMFLGTQYREIHTAYALGLRDDDTKWQDIKGFFDGLELIFSMLYLIELGLRVYFLGRSHFRKFWNIFDSLIVLITSFDFFLSAVTDWGADGSWLPVARVIRIARVARFAKIVRVAQVFGELRIIIRTLVASVRGLLWAVLFTFGIILAGGILITQLLAGFMQDKDASFKDREYLYERYGSASKATWTLWGHTFTGRWTSDARLMTERVDGLYALFWIFWIVGVNFAVMRVIAALFLKQTLAVANDDAQKMALKKIKERNHFVDMIREIFHRADADESGALTADEFLNMINDPQVAENFKRLDLELFEVTMLFRLLAHDGEADYDEFLQGALQLKEAASNTDVIKILHETIMIRKTLANLEAGITSLESGPQFFRAPVMQFMPPHSNQPRQDLDEGQGNSGAGVKTTDAADLATVNSKAVKEPAEPNPPSNTPQWSVKV